jgi:regulator of sigma E protease
MSAVRCRSWRSSACRSRSSTCFPSFPLDGGHIFWSLVEKLRGRAVPFRVMEQAGVVGFMLVIFLFFIGLTNDIGRLTGGGFETR